ncbi:50S ribosomal protein L4 [Candidatus Kaiserbacteria bacterium CG10_big_fil_rev_8_21_14_0_10_56_12]|uniref:Large ribosomal subunit protein uL4 n=1 Tax=Candidatus Kaiserbacteria bacterium CG10_big_fil_rev_8_21_14_0_10_56_12 TaxID=1974611 RepID=A0A2H0U9E7_9BACT|nr:MAG: 50S ribosomal protein L4 [Candidatus Kaiserbacteria bacterium CG10_big_fil_rev_8_21_14_0_10_56_12]
MATTTTTQKTPTTPAPKAEKKAVAARELTVYAMDGKKVSTIALPPEIFGAPWRADLVHQVTTGMQANARQNRAHTKDRAEVSGGGKKPWRQKGTGQARHGSSRSPIWRHGGVTFGPRNERDYSEKINRKMRAGALASVLSRKAKDGEIILVDKFHFAAPKTAEAKGSLVALAKEASVAKLVTKRKNAALLATAAYDANTLKSFKNLSSIATEEVRNLNPVDLLSHTYLIIENPEVAFKTLIARVKNV